MGWAESVSPNGMGRNRTGPIDIWAQMGRAQTGWAESAGHPLKIIANNCTPPLPSLQCRGYSGISDRLCRSYNSISELQAALLSIFLSPDPSLISSCYHVMSPRSQHVLVTASVSTVIVKLR